MATPISGSGPNAAKPKTVTYKRNGKAQPETKPAKASLPKAR